MILKTKTAKSAAPIKWHGGKTYLAPRIIELFPDHTHYVEPYFGGGAVLFRKPQEWTEGHSEVVNDLYGDLVNFWKVLQSRSLFPEFCRLANLIPLSQATWKEACQCQSDDPIEKALAFFVRYRQSRQGLGKDFATMSRTRTRRGMNEQVSSWLSAVDGLQEAHERLQRVVITCDSAIRIIRQEDDLRTFFYCDPPYVAETRTAPKAYSFEMTQDDHAELLETLGQIKGTFLLSGYRSALYDTAAKKMGWNRVDIEIDNKASSQKTKPRKVECLWKNY